MNPLNIHRFKQYYNTIIREDLLTKYRYLNANKIVSITKIVLHISSKNVILDTKQLVGILFLLNLIAGQKASITKAKKSVATFKIRKGMYIGAKVTLRRGKMYQFLERLVMYILPRQRELESYKITNLDSKGNFSLGLENLMLFPEIELESEKFPKMYGVDINMEIKTTKKKEALFLLSLFQIPFKKP